MSADDKKQELSGTQFHTLDKRLAVVETRLDDQDRELRTIHNSIDDINRGIQANTHLLQSHIKEDAAQQTQMVGRINVVLWSVILSFSVALVIYLLGRSG